jgi:hypothetical protein
MDQATSAQDSVAGSGQTPVPVSPLDTLFQIKDGPKGRGLFATQNIPPRTVIHVAPCLPVRQDEYENHMRFTILEHYLFNDSGGNKLLALGYGSLFNHSRSPNVDYRIGEGSIAYSSGHKQILQGEELCISYGANLWFDDADGADDSSDSSEENLEDGVAGFLGRIELGEAEED